MKKLLAISLTVNVLGGLYIVGQHEELKKYIRYHRRMSNWANVASDILKHYTETVPDFDGPTALKDKLAAYLIMYDNDMA